LNDLSQSITLGFIWPTDISIRVDDGAKSVYQKRIKICSGVFSQLLKSVTHRQGPFIRTFTDNGVEGINHPNDSSF